MQRTETCAHRKLCVIGAVEKRKAPSTRQETPRHNSGRRKLVVVVAPSTSCLVCGTTSTLLTSESKGNLLIAWPVMGTRRSRRTFLAHMHLPFPFVMAHLEARGSTPHLSSSRSEKHWSLEIIPIPTPWTMLHSPPPLKALRPCVACGCSLLTNDYLGW